MVTPVRPQAGVLETHRFDRTVRQRWGPLLNPTLRPGLGRSRQVHAALEPRLCSRTNEPSQGLTINWLLQEAIEWPDLPCRLIFCRADENQH